MCSVKGGKEKKEVWQKKRSQVLRAGCKAVKKDFVLFKSLGAVIYLFENSFHTLSLFGQINFPFSDWSEKFVLAW